MLWSCGCAGYKKEDIDINISKDGSEISVSGEKEVQEMQMIPFKKEVKTKGFAKKFRIPDRVVLDRIKAKYNEVDAVLRIVMPKMELEKGMTEIEEVQEREEVDRVTAEAEKIEEETCPVKKPKKPWTPSPPFYYGGSTLLLTLLFLVIHYIRARKS